MPSTCVVTQKEEIKTKLHSSKYITIQVDVHFPILCRLALFTSISVSSDYSMVLLLQKVKQIKQIVAFWEKTNIMDSSNAAENIMIIEDWLVINTTLQPRNTSTAWKSISNNLNMQSYIKHLPYASAICRHQVTIFFDWQLLISGQTDRLSPQKQNYRMFDMHFLCARCLSNA